MERRDFLKDAAAGGALAGLSGGISGPVSAHAREKRRDVIVRENGKYDILLKGGWVIDPANAVNGPMDVAVAGGKIALVRENIPAEEARKTIDVSGLYVSPGFIDIHVHVDYLKNDFIIADSHQLNSGVTTCVDAGSAGAHTFGVMEEIIDEARVRVFAFLNIAAGGMNETEQDPRTYRVDLAVETAKRYSDLIVGFKIAHYWTVRPYDDLHTPWANVDAVTAAGRKADLPCMFDWFPRPASDGYPMRSYRELILEKSRPGDIHTHHYARHIPVIDENGAVNPDVFKAQERGFIFDCGHGQGSFVWRNAVPAIRQGFISDSISTDLHRGNTNGPVVTMINVMSKYRCLGVSLEEVIRRSTVNPAREIRHPELGTLSQGAIADVAVFGESTGNFTYLDTSGGGFRGEKKLEPIMTLFGGEIVFDPLALSCPPWKTIPKNDDYWVNPSKQHF